MIQVELYRSIDDNKPTVCMVPDCWAELNAEQFATIAYVIHNYKEVEYIQVRILKALLQLPEGMLNRIDSDTVEADMLQLTEFVTQPCDMITQLFPYLKAGDTMLYGPADGMANLIAVEFDFAERFLQDWTADMDNDTLLWQFVACLYRPAKKGYDHAKNADGDCREAFNDNTITYYADLLQKYAPKKYAYAIVLWFKACHLSWQQLYPRIWQKNNDAPPTDDSTVVPGYFSLMRLVAKSGIYGNFEQVERMYMLNLLNEFESILIEQDKLEEQMRNMNNRA